MSYIGKNKQGEEVFIKADGGRYVMKDGEVVSELSSPTGFDPYNPLSNDRHKTVLEIVEGICRQHDQAIGGIGAVAGVRAMAKHWDSHLREGQPPRIIIQDIDELKLQLDNIAADLRSALNLPESTS